MREILLGHLLAQAPSAAADTMQIVHAFIDESIVESVAAYADADRAQREAQRARRTEIERHLLGIVTHDLRTPLTAITVGTRLLMRSESLSERQQALLSGITAAVGRAYRLLNDLVDFACMRLGKGLQVISDWTDLCVIAQEAIGELQLAHPERGDPLHLRARPRRPLGCPAARPAAHEPPQQRAQVRFASHAGQLAHCRQRGRGKHRRAQPRTGDSP